MATYWENSCSFGLRYVSWYKYLIVSLVFSHLGFWCGNLFLIAPFPDLCLLVPFCVGSGLNTECWFFTSESSILYCRFCEIGDMVIQLQSHKDMTVSLLRMFSNLKMTKPVACS